MAIIRTLYRQHQSKKLFEARASLLEKGVYPFDVFLKEHSEAITAAEKIEQLEEVAAAFKAEVPTLFIFTQQNTSVLLECGKSSPESIKNAMVNYAFVCEALNKCVNEAAKLFLAKNPREKTLQGLYKTDAVELLEFCIKKAMAYKLLEGNADPVIHNLAVELSALSIEKLNKLCESTPRMRLYVSNTLHNNLAKTILEG